jgi:glycosyltransferase involved in cell wall biosynthesis
MNIAFYAPFKPLGHKNPSGDLAIGQSLVDFLEHQGHTLMVQSRIRARWIYFKPWLWAILVKDYAWILFRLLKEPPDLWLTYHTYYKAPDLIGPWICRILGIKYLVFQGIYSTKQKRNLKTVLGFYLNRAALKQADHVFTNKAPDLKNLKRLIPPDRLTYIKPGIRLERFKKKPDSVSKNKEKWCKPGCPIILTAAMFRDDVKTKGLIWLIQCCEKLLESNISFHLVIAGDGKMKKKLKILAQHHLPGHHTFAGKIDREKMDAFYNTGDVFAFPGIQESLGMVFLEAQSCALPVVAFDNAGIPEVVKDQKTGFLVPMYDCTAFSGRLETLLSDQNLRREMGSQAACYVRKNHNIEKNYKKFEQVLKQMVA